MHEHWSKPLLAEDNYCLVYFLKNWIYTLGVLYKSIYQVEERKSMKGNTLDASF